MYFTKDSESAEDWDDVSTESWEDFTDDSSEIFSQCDETYDRDTTELANKKIEPFPADTVQDEQKISQLTRHVSAPNLLAMTYETPIIDHSDKKRESARAQRVKKKRAANVMKFSFHG